MLPYINIFGLKLPMYGICMAVGILIAGFLIIRESIARKLLWEDAVTIGAVAFGAGIVGAKLLYVFVTFTPIELFNIIKSGRWMPIMQGGFVFYGGLIFGIAGVFLGVKIANAKLADYENMLVKAVPLVHGFGRIGCFFAGCCYGVPAKSGFAVSFSAPLSAAPVGVPLVPIQLYEAAFNFLLASVLWGVDFKWKKNHVILPIYILAYSTERFFAEFFRYDTARGFFCGVSTSQWISVGLFLVGVVILAVRVFNVKRVD